MRLVIVRALPVCLVIITCRPQYPPANHRRSSFSGRCIPIVEHCRWTSRRRHQCLVLGNVWRSISSQSFSPAPNYYTLVRAQWICHFGQSSRFFFFTYTSGETLASPKFVDWSVWYSAADSERGPSRLRPPPIGRQTDAVTHSHVTECFKLWSFCCKTWYSEYSKWLPPLTSLECTEFVFGWGSAPDPTGELIALLIPSSWFKGHYF